MTIEVGRLCIKIAGRDAGLKCVIIEILDKNYVMIDGQTRRRKCNILHLEPLKDVIKIKKGSSHETVKKEFEKLKLEVKETKPKSVKEKPIKKRNLPKEKPTKKEGMKKDKVKEKKTLTEKTKEGEKSKKSKSIPKK